MLCFLSYSKVANASNERPSLIKVGSRGSASFRMDANGTPVIWKRGTWRSEILRAGPRPSLAAASTLLTLRTRQCFPRSVQRSSSGLQAIFFEAGLNRKRRANARYQRTERASFDTERRLYNYTRPSRRRGFCSIGYRGFHFVPTLRAEIPRRNGEDRSENPARILRE